MRTISKEKIDEIRNSADIVNIISEVIPLKAQGKNYFGVCPFHDDHNPSMSVSRERQYFKCFVCNKGGNVFDFVKDYDNISFIEAVKRVADKVGIPLDISNYHSEDTRFKKEFEIMDFANKVFHNNLFSSEGLKAKEYLEKRNITEDIIKEFKIGYSLNKKDYLFNVLSKKYDINTLDSLGIITKDGLKGYDTFVDRVMIPLCNLDGNIVGWTGRTIDRTDVAKYINTKETIIYKKGNTLFNYHNAKNYIRDAKSVILVEGNMDAIRIYASGIKNVLALMGTALTKEQIQILKRLRVPVILMLDSDNAGEIATNNVGEALTNNNIEVQVVRLEDAKDPDEYILKHGVESFKKRIDNAINYFDYKLDVLKNDKDLKQTEDLVVYIQNVIKLLSDKDNLTKEITLKKLSDEYNLDYEVLKKEVTFNKEEKPKIIVNPKKENRIINKYNACVNEILFYLMSDPKYLKIYNKRLGYLKNKEERYLINEIEYYIEKYGSINVADFLSYIEFDNSIKDFVNNIVGSAISEELSEKTFLEYIDKVNEILNKDARKKLIEELKYEKDDDKKLEKVNRLTELVKGSVNNGRD